MFHVKHLPTFTLIYISSPVRLLFVYLIAEGSVILHNLDFHPLPSCKVILFIDSNRIIE